MTATPHFLPKGQFYAHFPFLLPQFRWPLLLLLLSHSNLWAFWLFPPLHPPHWNRREISTILAMLFLPKKLERRRQNEWAAYMDKIQQLMNKLPNVYSKKSFAPHSCSKNPPSSNGSKIWSHTCIPSYPYGRKQLELVFDLTIKSWPPENEGKAKKMIGIKNMRDWKMLENDRFKPRIRKNRNDQIHR